MTRERAAETVSLRQKLNLIIVNAVLFSSLSVLILAFCAHCQQIDRIHQLLSIEECFPVSNLYIQRDEGELTYNLIDPEESLLNIDSVEIPVEEFQEFEANARVPATVYHSAYGWLRPACETVYLFSTHEPFARISADIDIHYRGNHAENNTNTSL